MRISLKIIALIFVIPVINGCLSVDKKAPENDSVYKNFSLENSFFRYNNFIDLKLTEAQSKILSDFINVFNSDPKYINELIEKSKTTAFSINNISIEKYDWENKYAIVLAITFYSDYKIYEMWQYNEKDNIWWTFNSAYYYFDNNEINLQGWGF